MKSRKKKSNASCEATPEKSESSAPPRSVQLSITEFYRASKASRAGKTEENAENKSPGSSQGRKRDLNSRLSKSVRRRLLFG